jgi:hypothetical protein
MSHSTRSKRRVPISARGRREPVRIDPDTRDRALEAVRYVREGLSPTRAAHRAHTKLLTVVKYVPRAIHRTKDGHYAVTASDAYSRRLWMLTAKGKKEVVVRGSKAASKIAAYWSAVFRFQFSGKTDWLKKFRGQSVKTNAGELPFITNTVVLTRLGFAGETDFPELYLVA